MPRRRRGHHELALDSSHWRKDGRPKVRYSSRGEALSAADLRGAQTDTPLTVYLCPYCSGWHMGSRSEDRPD